jgi:hypothetical protein
MPYPGNLYDYKTLLVDSSGNAISIGGSGASAQQVQGNVATGAAVSGGNPIGLGISDGTNLQYVRQIASSIANPGAGVLAAAMMVRASSTGTLFSVQTGQLNDADNGGSSVSVVSGVYNSASWDKIRSAPGATGTTGTGLLGTGPCLWDSVGATNFVKQAGDGSGRAIVIGAAAAAAALAGNPVTIAISDGTNAQIPRSGSVDGQPNNATQAAALYAWNGSSTVGWDRLANVSGASDGSGLSKSLVTTPYNFNGTTVDRQRSANAAANTTGTGLLGAGGLVYDGTNWQVVKQLPSATASQSATGWPIAGIGLSLGSGNGAPLVAASLLADGTPATNAACVSNWLYNNTNFDRQRGNTDVSLTTQTGATTTFTSADQTSYNSGHITVVLDMTNVGTGSVTLEIDGKDIISGKYYVLIAGAAVVTNSTNVYYVGPGLPATANVSANVPMPRVFRIKVTANNANACTYTVGYSLQCN